MKAGLLASPDGWVASQGAELRETPDAMPAHVSVENQWGQDRHRAMGGLVEEHPLMGSRSAGAGSHGRIPVSAGLQRPCGGAPRPRRSVPSDTVLQAVKDRLTSRLSNLDLNRGLNQCLQSVEDWLRIQC